MLIGLVADANHHENVSGGFPHGIEGALDVIESVWDTNFLFDFVGLVSSGFSLFVLSQIVGSEVPFLVVSGLEPGDHGVVIALLDDVLVGPFSVFSVKYVEGLVFFLGWVMIVAELESIVVVSSDFLNTKELGLGESYDVRLIGFLVEEVMFGSSELVGFKVKNEDSGVMLLGAFWAEVPFGPGFEEDELSV